jgi:hypothetical protein
MDLLYQKKLMGGAVLALLAQMFHCLAQAFRIGVEGAQNKLLPDGVFPPFPQLPAQLDNVKMLQCLAQQFELFNDEIKLSPPNAVTCDVLELASKLLHIHLSEIAQIETSYQPGVVELGLNEGLDSCDLGTDYIFAVQ